MHETLKHIPEEIRSAGEVKESLIKTEVQVDLQQTVDTALGTDQEMKAENMLESIEWSLVEWGVITQIELQEIVEIAVRDFKKYIDFLNAAGKSPSKEEVDDIWNDIQHKVLATLPNKGKKDALKEKCTDSGIIDKKQIELHQNQARVSYRRRTQTTIDRFEEQRRTKGTVEPLKFIDMPESMFDDFDGFWDDEIDKVKRATGKQRR